MNLDVRNDDGIRIADLSYMEKHLQILNKESTPCQDYEDNKENGFVNCCKDKIRAQLAESANCSIPVFDGIFESENLLEECSSRESAHLMDELFLQAWT